MKKEKCISNPNDEHKYFAKLEDDKPQKTEDTFEEGKEKLSVYEQIKLGIQQAIEFERTNKK